MADRRLSLALFLLTFLSYAYFFGGAGWNQNAHFDLTRAIVERGSFAIDDFASNTGDVSYSGGHLYANKAPGLSFLAVPPYAVARLLTAASGFAETDALAMILSMWFCTVATCGLAGALIPVVVFTHLRNRFGQTTFVSLVAALCIAFGTYVFAYSTVLFAHVPGALFLLVSFVLRRTRPFTAGVSAGVAGLTNYLCIPAALLLCVASGRSNVHRFIAGGVPSALVLLWYQAEAFGSPFASSITTMDERFVTEGAFLGALTRPSLKVLWELTISRYRGLLYLSPVLIFAFGGAIVMLRHRLFRQEVAVIAGIVSIFLLFNMSFNGWHGGSAIGPRYLLPVVPLLGIPVAFGFRILRPLFVAAAILSCVSNFVVTAVNPMTSRVIRDPIGDYIFPLFIDGRLPDDIAAGPLWSWKVMLGHVSVNRHTPDERYPFTRHAPGSSAAEWASFNIGEIAAPGRSWSVVPCLLLIGVGSWLLLMYARHIDREEILAPDIG